MGLIEMPVSDPGIRFNLDWRMTLLALLALSGLSGLGWWQLERADEKALIAAAWEERQSQRPVALGLLWDKPAADLAHMPVKLSGVFLQDKYFFLDNRIFNGRFGYEVLAIMQLDSGQGLALVNRGWLAADPARRELPAVPWDGQRVELTANVYVAPGAPYMLAEQRLDGGWPKLLQAVEMAKILPLVEAISGERVFPYAIRIASGQPGALAVDWQVINVSPEKHKAYAVQWFTMALVLLIFLLLRGSNLWQWVKSSRRDRR